MAKKIEVKNRVLEKGVHYLESPFGIREYPKGVITKHNGDDLLGENKGADYVVAIDDGIVKEVNYSTSRGYYVGIKMRNQFVVRYLHLKKGSIEVKVGQRVVKGQRIAFMGNTGYYKDANGKSHQVNTHLHFAVIDYNGSYVDPLPYLQGKETFNITWETGDYEVLFNKYLRTSPKVAVGNKARYSNLSSVAKTKCIKDKLGYAKYKIGAKINIKEFRYDEVGNLWGRTNTLWVCVYDTNGYQVKKV